VLKKYFHLGLKQYNQIRASKFFKVFLWDVLSKGADFVLLPIYLKILSQQEYGFYTYILYIITSASGLFKLGLDTAISKMYYETDKYERGSMMFSTHSIWVICFFTVTSICYLSGLDVNVLSKVLAIPTENYLQIRFSFFLFIFFNLIQNTLNVFFVIDNNAIVYQKYNLIRVVLGNIVIISLLGFINTGNKAYLRLYIEPVIFTLSFIPIMVILVKKLKYRLDMKAINQGFKVGLPMVGTLIVGIIYNLSDKYFLQQSSGYNELAIYNLALFLTLPVSLIFSSFQTVWFPQFLQVKTEAERFEKSNRFSIQLSWSYLILLIALWLGLILCILVNIFPASYLPIIYIFPFIFFAKVADNLVQIYNNFVVAWGKTFFNFFASILFGLLTFLLNFFLIPFFGLKAAVAILLTISCIRIFTFFSFVKLNITKS
jgi:O-antigen/teichoic acid export membrane protein